MIMSKMGHKNCSQRMKHTITAVMCVLFMACVATFPLGAAESPLKKASLMPMWSPQAQFAGYYVAHDKGIYARHGIDLKILRAGPGCSPAESLEKGTADFAILWLTTALQHRSAGTELINLAQIIQRSSMMLISKKRPASRPSMTLTAKKWGCGKATCQFRSAHCSRSIASRFVKFASPTPSISFCAAASM